MNLAEAFDFVAAQRPAWKDGKNWAKPFCFNREHILRLLGANKNVNKITKADLAKLRTALLSENGKKGRRTPGGVNRIMSMLNTLLKDLEENEIIDKAPKIKALPENNQRMAFYTQKDIHQMVNISQDVFHNPELADAILFGVYTGCRQSELLALTVNDVDLRNKLLTFRDTKNGTDHLLDIHKELVPILERRVTNKPPGSPVFNFANKDDLYYTFKKVRALCGLSEDHVWHTLRHTTGTWLAEKGVPLQTIAKILNHKSIQTTERYVKITDSARRNAVNLL